MERPKLYFNSQPHKEADSVNERKNNWNQISTHSLTRRLTECHGSSWKSGDYFNSQPHKEADKSKLLLMEFPKHFNSQPHKEADQEAIENGVPDDISTHSLTRRLTVGCSSITAPIAFQLTASQGG